MSCWRGFVPLLLLAPGVAQAGAGVQLAGQVTDAALRPLVNCAVTVEANGREVAKTRSDATGCFFVGRLPGQSVLVRATAAADVGAVPVDLTWVDRGFVRVPLYPARTLRGRVHTPDGSAVAGAWILATPTEDRELAAIDAMAQSGSDGRYELSHVLVGPVRVRAFAEGREIFEATVEGGEDATLDCELDDAPRREVVFVLGGATPAQLATAELQVTAVRGDELPTRLPPPLRTMRPDAEGRCVVRGWSSDDRLVGRFEVPGVAVVPPVDFAPKGPHQWTCRYDVQASAGLCGVLRDLEGSPLAGQRLLCRPFDEGAEIAGVADITAGDGSFRLPAPVGFGDRFVLSIVGSDHCVVHPVSRAQGFLSSFVGRHEGSARHEVVARASPPVRLQVVDQEGQVVRGARVTVRQAGSARPVVEAGSPRSIVRQGCTDASGRLSFRGIDLREAGFLAFDVEALAGVAMATCTIGDGAGVDLGTVTLANATPFAGIVRDAQGSPAVGVRVRLVGYDGWMVQRVVLTGRDGRFAFGGLRPGTYGYVAHRGGVHAMVRDRVVLTAEGLADLELRVQ